jgi:hypothetical protein
LFWDGSQEAKMTDYNAGRASGIREAAEVASSFGCCHVPNEIAADILALLDAPAPAGVTVPDELYQAAKRDAEEAEAYAAELEAKLAKFWDVLDWAVICWDDHNKHGYEMQGDWVPDARATLSELKGEKYE